MAYASLDILTDRFGETMLTELTDRAEPPAGEVDTDVIDRVLTDTDAVIDGHLGGRYELPLAATPPLVVDLAVAIAIYKLHTYDPDPKITRDYEGALRTLKMIGEGTVRLDLAGVEPETSGSGGVRITDRERPFTETNLKGFI